MEILLAIALGFGGGWWFHDPAPIDCQDQALITASCPPLTKLEDASFGGHVIKIQEIASQYRACRVACVK